MLLVGMSVILLPFLIKINGLKRLIFKTLSDKEEK